MDDYHEVSDEQRRVNRRLLPNRRARRAAAKDLLGADGTRGQRMAKIDDHDDYDYDDSSFDVDGNFISVIMMIND